MAQQALRKRKRTNGGTLWRGLLWAVGVTAAAVIVFAQIIAWTDVSDGVIRVINQIIKTGAIFVGVRAATGRGEENAIRKGALLGLIYMGVGVALYAVLTRQQVSVWGYVLDALMGVAAGGLSGMVMSSLKSKAA